LFEDEIPVEKQAHIITHVSRIGMSKDACSAHCDVVQKYFGAEFGASVSLNNTADLNIAPDLESHDAHTILGVDVENQYIAISALRTLTAPVPWDATCE
jgi:hypothetical protein